MITVANIQNTYDKYIEYINKYKKYTECNVHPKEIINSTKVKKTEYIIILIK